MAEGYASSLIQSLRGNGMPGATVGDAGVTELQFPWMNSASIPLRQRVAPAVALKNPEKLSFTQYTPRDPLAKQREQNALWDKQTGGPTGDRINPVAVLIDANKDRVKPIETGNPVFNLEQSMPAEMRQPLQDFAFIGPTEMENKLMPASDMAPAPPPPAVEQAPPARLDPRDYRLQEEPQPMFAGLIPPANPPPVSEEPQPALADLLPPSEQPQPIMEAPTLREEIMAAIAQQEAPAPEPVVEPLQFSDAELEMLVAMLEEEGRG